MSQENQTFEIKSGVLNRKLEIAGDKLRSYAPVGNKVLLEVPLVNIKEIRKKAAALSGGGRINLKIIYDVNGRKKSFPDFNGIDGTAQDQDLIRFVEALTSRVPSVPVTDGRAGPDVREQNGVRTVPIAISLLGAGAMLMPRWLNLCLLGLLMIPLVLTIPLFLLIVSRGYRLQLHGSGLQLTKIFSREIPLDMILKVEPEYVELVGEYQQNMGNVVNFHIQTTDGKRHRFTCRFAEARYLVDEFVRMGKMDESLQKRFAA